MITTKIRKCVLPNTMSSTLVNWVASTLYAHWYVPPSARATDLMIKSYFSAGSVFRPYLVSSKMDLPVEISCGFTASVMYSDHTSLVPLHRRVTLSPSIAAALRGDCTSCPFVPATKR